MDLTIIVPVPAKGDGAEEWGAALEREAQRLGLQQELLIIRNAAYGDALSQGFKQARGEFIFTVDPSPTFDPSFLVEIWNARHRGEVIIGSRYISGAKVQMPFLRRTTSRLMNLIFRRGVSMPCRDLSSAVRLYTTSALKSIAIEGRDYDALPEILIKLYAGGSRVEEIPIGYRAAIKLNRHHLRLLRDYLVTFWRMYKLRNSIASADYDDRAYDSVIPVQRYWQRRRCGILQRFAAAGGLLLDVGCGSTQLLSSNLSPVGLDILLNKLRYARKYGRPLVNGSIWSLPFRDAVFDCVICSEVIEHIAAGRKPFLELRRILKRGGILVIGTPDYAHFTWRAIEALYRIIVPGGYADEHITHYTKESLTALLTELGFRIMSAEYVVHSELILQCQYINEGNAATGNAKADTGS